MDFRPSSDGAGKRARRARRFEHDADHLVIETREAVRVRPDYSVFLSLMQAADDAADELEDAAFLLDLNKLQGSRWRRCRPLADLLAEASQEWIKARGTRHPDRPCSERSRNRRFPGVHRSPLRP